jgi:hypothetical protein
MSSTKTTTQLKQAVYDQDYITCLRWAHNKTLAQQGITEQQWADNLFSLGNDFAEMFCRLYGQKKDDMALLITSHQWYWNWWRSAYLRDDHQFIINKVHQQAISYSQYKAYMLNCEYLEEELISLIQSNTI